ncbi:TonB-dependent receptor [Pareuzebyella sediminis]|uniref:TonB-dependent receptor n=1 Tax=Pareuzebyella sediminis TaxID=2607998 RepID=UPI0011EE6E9E|nr:TonB-dependent receptor [Pareuzebyella sediminis]
MIHKFITVLIVVLSGTIYAQNSLEGTLSETGTNAPLFGVDVYFPQLEKGAMSDEKGMFRITNLPTGSYKIIASYIGFKTYSTTVNIAKGNNTLTISLAPSAIEMEEVIVSTPFHKLQRENVMKVERADIADLRSKGAVTLADGITNVPGVETVSTGIGIGKPVIRGLSANRVLVYTQGVRLENQQFGDEHGLGVSDAGIESVEVIKGPSSLLYGSDALGGVLYLNPEKFALEGQTESDVNLNYFSNTDGLGANAGIKASGDRMRYLIRGSIASHADYQTGKNNEQTPQKVTNSRFREYDLKTGIGYQGTNIKTELRYNYNNLLLGLPEEIGEQTTERTPLSPYQQINNHILSSKTSLFFEKSSVDATLGYTFNTRKEFEENEDGAALDMNLSTLSYNLLYHLPKGANWETILGIQGMHQNNRNFGEETLIPDATTNDFGILGTSHLHFSNNSDLQIGVRFDHRSIDSQMMGTLSEEGYMAALNQNFNSFNAAIGYKWEFLQKLTGRLNLASGFRAPNLAELRSNGVHEGTNRYEIGNANLINEKNIQADLALEYKNRHLEWYVNGFYNGVSDYIFLDPNGETIDNSPVFLYQQQNAKLYGGEIGVHIHPHPLDWLHLESSFETVTGKLEDGDFLPLIPANSLTNTLRTEFLHGSDKIRSSYAFLTLKSIFDQNKTSAFETSTEGYNLLSIGLGAQLSLFDQEVNLRLSGNNLLNEYYIAHLSRLKSDGIANIGRNINIGLSVPL